jgi:Protein of unknown function (DUF2911)
MLKRTALAAVALAVAAPLFAQGNPRGEAKAMVADKTVSIDYGRPSLKGRDMLGQAQIGQAWRMGADASTSLKTEADLSFGSVHVPKGEYVLTATKVSADQWHLNVLAKEDRSKIADIPLAMSKAGPSVEIFTVELKGDKDKGEFSMTWGTTALKADFTAK